MKSWVMLTQQWRSNFHFFLRARTYLFPHVGLRAAGIPGSWSGQLGRWSESMWLCAFQLPQSSKNVFPLIMHNIAAQILARINICLTEQLATCLSSAGEQYQGNQLRLLSAEMLSRTKIRRIIPLRGPSNRYRYPCLHSQCRYLFNFLCYIFDYIMQ